jgi:hypothetical protein
MMLRALTLIGGLALLRLSATHPPDASDDARPRFVNVSADAGVDYTHVKPLFDQKLANVMPWITSIHAGVAVADVNGDGHEDIYFLSSRRGVPNALFLGDGRFHFREAASSAGLADLNDDRGVSMDAVFGDLDNDGDEDLFVASYGRSRLLRNDAGRFVDVTDAAGLGRPGNASCAVLFDADGDGFLDIMVGYYFPNIDLWNVPTTRVLQETLERARNGGRNRLYRNNHDGTFTDIAATAGVDDSGWALDIGAGDLDNDGDPDIYVANDFGEDVLYRNDGGGKFTNVTRTGTGGDFDAGMNVDLGDYDNDGPARHLCDQHHEQRNPPGQHVVVEPRRHAFPQRCRRNADARRRLGLVCEVPRL